MRRKYLTYADANKSSGAAARDRMGLKPLLVAFPDYLSTITSKAIEEYKAQRLQRVKPATVNRELALLKHVLTKAIEWGYLKENSAKAVKLLKEPPGRVRYLTPDELTRLPDACAPHLKPIVLMAVHTGMRVREILTLTWPQVDVRRRILTLMRTKNQERRISPLNDQAIEVLRTLPRHVESTSVFCDQDGRPYQCVVKGLRQACKRAGIGDSRFHDLRHTFASHLVVRGVPLRTAQELLGHKTGQMTLRYTHLSTPHLQEAVDILQTAFALAPNTQLEKPQN